VTSPALRIEQATERDVPLILEFIRALAIYEDHLEYFEATEERLRHALFGPQPVAYVLLAYQGVEPAGFAVYFHTLSTFAGLPGFYLEDLFVKPEWRGKGIGKALLRELARRALQQNFWRIEWAVLHWNENAIKFYKNLGAIPRDEWTVYHLSGEALRRLAE
jgi:GNAT superfamily N-acetyltransferase